MRCTATLFLWLALAVTLTVWGLRDPGDTCSTGAGNGTCTDDIDCGYFGPGKLGGKCLQGRCSCFSGFTCPYCSSTGARILSNNSPLSFQSNVSHDEVTCYVPVDPNFPTPPPPPPSTPMLMSASPPPPQLCGARCGVHCYHLTCDVGRCNGVFAAVSTTLCVCVAGTSCATSSGGAPCSSPSDCGDFGGGVYGGDCLAGKCLCKAGYACANCQSKGKHTCGTRVKGASHDVVWVSVRL